MNNFTLEENTLAEPGNEPGTFGAVSNDNAPDKELRINYYNLDFHKTNLTEE